MRFLWEFFFFKTLFIFNWRIIALQCCVGFCLTSAWISHRCTYVPLLLNLPPAPLGFHRTPGWAPCVRQQIPTGCPFQGYVVRYMFQCYLLNSSHPLLPTLCLQVCSLMSASPLLVCRYVHQYHFSSFHIYVLIYDICFLFLTYFTLYKRLCVHPPQQNWLQFISVYGWVIFHCIYIHHNFFIHSSVDGHLGCFHVLAVVNSAAITLGYSIFYSCGCEVSLDRIF